MKHLMKKHVCTGLCLAVLFASCTALEAQDVRRITRIDSEWKFLRGDAENAHMPSFDDSSLRTLNLPHDWSIEGDYDPESPVKRGGGYLPAGVGWYRKNIAVDKAWKGRRIFIEFGAVMANSDVWINGHHLGHRPTGYLPLLYDLTGYLHFDGKPNVVAVRADNTVQPASRWYAGAGIYRHVDLIAVNPVHLERRGVFIHTPEISAAKASVSIEASVANMSGKSQSISLRTTIVAPSGKSVHSSPAQLVAKAGESVRCVQSVAVSDPELWDIESPSIYTAVTRVTVGGKVVDEQVNTFGIREIRFESETGFYLNGRNIKLLGACVHHDGGALGAAVPASAWERRLLLLKEIGCNAIRGAHSPMNPEFYDLCDRLGLLVMDETFDTWTAAKPNGEKAYNLYFNDWWETDARAQIMRVRNHPCVIIYSLGNEIRYNLNGDGRQRFLDLRDLTKALDPTRPVTMALFRPVQMHLFENGFSELLDVIGQNYGEKGLIAAWAARAGRKIIGTENTPSRSAWLDVRNTPAMAGMFIWTGFDYLGEADWPKTGWSAGLFDRNGGWKPSSWERQSWWTDRPMVHIVRRDDSGAGLTDDWTVASDTVGKVEVTVYSNCEEVELYLNGVSLGRQAVADDDDANRWTVDFRAGTVRAVGRNGGKDVATHEHHTASTPARIVLTAEKSTLTCDWDDVVYVTATVTDENGVRHPNSNHTVKFSVSEGGEIVAVDNSDVYSHERYKSDRRTVCKGRAIAIVRATTGDGTFRLSASSDGLESDTARIVIVKKPLNAMHNTHK